MGRFADVDAPPLVGTLTLQTAIRDRGLDVYYRTDRSDRGSLTIDYPVVLDEADVAMVPVIVAGVGVYLAQLCLASRVVLDQPLADAVRSPLEQLAAMLYEVRCWKDGVPFRDGLVIEGTKGVTGPVAHDPHPSVAQLLFSGGKDSTLSALVLAANDYTVEAAHITTNAGVEDREAAAVADLAPKLGLEVAQVRYRHEEFLAFASRYAIEWDRAPRCNRVPFGRDLLLPLLVLPLARRNRAAVISMGHDHECRNAYVRWEGRVFPRNDVESAAGALLLEQLLQAGGLDRIELLPPVATRSELLILRDMLVDHPDLMEQISFCFWPGPSCGRCAKCLRYYLAQRVFRTDDVLRFAVNPLAAGASPELDDLLGAEDDNGLLFQKEVLYCLGRLVARGDVRPEEVCLARFGASARAASVIPLLDRWESELLTPGEDPQVRRPLRDPS